MSDSNVQDTQVSEKSYQDSEVEDQEENSMQLEETAPEIKQIENISDDNSENLVSDDDAYNPSEDETSRNEITRMKSLKISQTNFMNTLKKGGKKKKRGKEVDPQERMKELIQQAEKLASFLLSKHKMNAHDPRDKSAIRRKKTKSVSKEDIGRLL